MSSIVWWTSRPKYISAEREGGEVVFAEELILARACFVNLEVARKAVSLFSPAYAREVRRTERPEIPSGRTAIARAPARLTQNDPSAVRGL